MSDVPPGVVPSAKRVRARNWRTLRWFVLAAAVIAVLGLGLLYAERRPETSPVARGALLATSSGCLACHARSDGEQRANLRVTADGTWRPRSIPTLWESGIDEVSVLKDWIANGVPAEQAARHKELFIQMPAYRGHLDESEIEAVCAWILAEGVRISQPGAAAVAAGPEPKPEVLVTLKGDELFREGDRLSRQHGCYQCHGEMGQGGVLNPSSFKGYVAGFFGRDLGALTAGGDRAEILHWIDEGRGKALESGMTGGLAKYFLDRQAIKMPAYKHRLSAREKNILTDYVLALNQSGPLQAKELERILKLLTQEPDEKS